MTHKIWYLISQITQSEVPSNCIYCKRYCKWKQNRFGKYWVMFSTSFQHLALASARLNLLDTDQDGFLQRHELLVSSAPELKLFDFRRLGLTQGLGFTKKKTCCFMFIYTILYHVFSSRHFFSMIFFLAFWGVDM